MKHLNLLNEPGLKFSEIAEMNYVSERLNSNHSIVGGWWFNGRRLVRKLNPDELNAVELLKANNLIS